ncbi:MAG: thiolase family protein [Acidobacteria bacterium]|nr:thiolase family protein [Acidobacteriota bacterium]MDW7983245.1 thiolase family protein [Acidobacteriota bacterium]
MASDVVIVDGGRTPFADWNGRLADLSAIQLGAEVVRALLDRVGLPADAVDHVVFGNALQTSGDAIYGARHVALRAGLPVEVPAYTVNRLCGSGIQSIVEAFQMIRLGEARWVIAGGMENMSQAPHVVWGLRRGVRFGESLQLQDWLWLALRDPFCGLLMAETAERLAQIHGISRAAQDEYAYRSHQAAVRARTEGFFRDEILPVRVSWKGREETFDWDDHVRPDTTLEKLAGLRPYFSEDGFVTPGNASGIVDGAAAVVVTTTQEARAAGKKPLGRILGWAVAGVPPDVMGIGPVPAIRKLLDRLGLRVEDVHRWEINEAFAAQYLAVEKLLELDRSRVNVNGGAIALGHPLGATGTRLVLTLLRELRRSGLRYGVASACIGGGQGIAMAVEAL